MGPTRFRCAIQMVLVLLTHTYVHRCICYIYTHILKQRFQFWTKQKTLERL